MGKLSDYGGRMVESPWEAMSASAIRHLQSVRGQYRPILDPLGC